MESSSILGENQKPKWFDSLNELAEVSFDISFSKWQESGYLTEKYRPYLSIKYGKVIANASANLMNFAFAGKIWSGIQIGTVMTAQSHRNQGLAGGLIRDIISDWQDKVDFIYLFANDESASFYPQFGFERAYEYAYQKAIEVEPVYRPLESIDLNEYKWLDKLKEKYQEGNRYSALRSFDNFELLMFYCGLFMADSLYYIREYDLIAIIQKEGNILRCFELFGRTTVPLAEVLRKIEQAFTGVDTLELGFTPIDVSDFNTVRIDDFDHLFILKGSSLTDYLKDNKNIFPLLSHA